MPSVMMRDEPPVPEELRPGAIRFVDGPLATSRSGGPYQVVRDFERALCEYTGAPYAVTTSSCTAALLLAVKWAILSERSGAAWRAGDLAAMDRVGLDRVMSALPREYRPTVEIPRRTYVGVPCSIVHAGGRPTFRDEEWSGSYRLKPYPIWDSARWFTGGMYRGVHRSCVRKGNAMMLVDDERDLSGSMVCVSFHASKTLGDTQGGAILHDNPEADAWLRRMRFDGRTEGVAPKDDTFREVGHHCYLSNDVAARLLLKLSSLPRHNEPLANSDYPDLSLHEAFR